LVVLPILARRRRSLEGAGKNLGCSFKLDGCGPESPHLFDLFLTRAVTGREFVRCDRTAARRVDGRGVGSDAAFYAHSRAAAPQAAHVAPRWRLS
jgi:hypothetical protein